MKGYETEQNIILVVRGSSTCKDRANTNLCKRLKLCVLDERKTKPETLDPRPFASKQTHSSNPIFFSTFCISISRKKVSGRTITEGRKGRERKRGREVRIIEREREGWKRKIFQPKRSLRVIRLPFKDVC